MEPEEAISTGDDTTGALPPTAQEAPLPQGDSEPAPAQQAIPTGDDNSIPSGPIQQQQAPTAPQRFGPLGRLVSYLMGEGAAHPQVLQQAADQIDPESGMSASDRNLMVIEDANRRGGQEAAWKMLQANRVAYNAKQAFAYAALNGNQQKRPDVHAAVDAANQAADHVLDGSNARFMVSTGGQITATVKGPDGGPAQVFDLSADQFRQYLNPGRAGMWDRQMQPGGIGRTLTNITQNQQRVSSVGQLPPLAGARQAQAEPEEEARQGPQDPASTPQGQFRMTSPGEETYDPKLQKRAWGRFPGVGSSAERADFMAGQEAASDKLKNNVEVAETKGEAANTVAATRGTFGNQGKEIDAKSRETVAGTRLKGFMYASDAKKAAAQIVSDQKAAAAGSKDAQARIDSSRKAIATIRQTGGTLTPEQAETEKLLNQRGQQALQGQGAPAQQQAPAQGSGVQLAPDDPTQRKAGQQYKSKSGKVGTWDGSSWQQVH